jgi:hypothetical protein
VTEPRGDVCRVSARHRSSKKQESYGLDLVGLVPCRMTVGSPISAPQALDLYSP